MNVRVYDNEGKTIDRYTIVLLDDPLENGRYAALSVDQFGGRYFSQFSECIIGSHLGEEISLDILPKLTREHVISRLSE